MGNFFNNLSISEQIYWSVAIIGSVIFLILLILTFFGGDLDSDLDIDTEIDFETDGDSPSAGYQFFTFKNVVAFLTVFGWTGLTCINNGLPPNVTLLIATIAGLIMMVLTTLLFFWIHSFAESGTLKIDNAIGQIGKVYIPIGANQSKSGKISIDIQGSLRELDAVTNDNEDLKTGTIVKVIQVISDELLLVEKQ